jgi:thiamine biosynthesis lipoprotein
MGTTARATVIDADEAAAEEAVLRVRRVFDRVDATMSNWSADSELSRLNRAAASAYRIEDEDLAACIEAALDAAPRTGGSFDPTVGPLVTLWGFRPKAPRVPDAGAIAEALSRVGADAVRYDRTSRTVRFDRPGMEIDLGGIAKGYALDVARKQVAGAGRFGLLDLGGNLAWFGAPPGGSVVLSISDPWRPDLPCAEARLPAGYAAATSSDVENHFVVDGVSYGHIMDPRAGRPAVTDVIQATAVHPSATVTDVLSTALFVGGASRAASILAAYPGSEAVLIVRDGPRLALLASRSLEGRLRLVPGAGFTADSPRFTLPAATMAPSKTR